MIFRADASKAIGFGHFIRSLALASYLQDEFDCYFCTFNEDSLSPSPYQLKEIGDVCQYLPIAASSRKEFNNNFLATLNGDEIVVLDNYFFNDTFQGKIKEKGCRLVCIDDLHDRKMNCDALITFLPHKREIFDLPEDSRYLADLKYMLLRPPFLMEQEAGRKSGDYGKWVLAVGGADPYGLTNKLIEIILSTVKGVELSVIAGDTVIIDGKYRDKIILRSRLTAGDIADLFRKSDFGILSASTICIEALACGLPVAAGWYVDNQKEFYEYGTSNGLFFPLGNLFDDKSNIKARLLMAISQRRGPAAEIDFPRGKEEIKTLFKEL